jgi:cytochrome d ubiquinol oxidase subunit II
MLLVVLLFLGLAIYLYCLLAGADFGIGVNELFIKRENKKEHQQLVKEAMGPVWEANHMWLIIAVVILFVGFPKIYAEVSIYLHIPITLMLVGIIMRGCSFSFLHYDPIDDESHKVYSVIFSISSILTPITFGIIIGALMLGRIPPETGSYYATYVAPWCNPFCFTMGLLVLSIFTFTASVFMIGEEHVGSFKQGYLKRAKVFHLVMVLAGALAFITAEMSGYPLVNKFLSNPIALGAIALATFSHFLLWKYFETKSGWGLRLLTGFQILMVIVAWMDIVFPEGIYYSNGTVLSFFEAASPSSTLHVLGWALMGGSCLFLPLLSYLFFVFKRHLS